MKLDESLGWLHIHLPWIAWEKWHGVFGGWVMAENGGIDGD